MDRLKSILLYLIFSCPFVVFANGTDIYSGYSHSNYRSILGVNMEVDFESPNYKLLNALVFFRTNEIRVEKGLHALKHHERLEQAAGMHASDMLKGDFFAHDNPLQQERKTPSDRYRLCGISNPYAAENIANNFAIKYKANTAVYVLDEEKGLFSYEPDGEAIARHSYLSFAESVVEKWMGSKGHRENILRSTALELGCGCLFYRDKNGSMPKFMCVQNFQLYEAVVVKKTGL
ncbi:MAG: CAP domain-containing protein [Paludibacteraceae bacterium]|nr:CAP domain-containing protein [Paludibacteraceae bacterium]